MTESNPYFQTYCEQMHQEYEQNSKEHLVYMAINLAHVHNLFGIMISDVMTFMGNLPFKQGRRRNQQENPDKSKSKKQINNEKSQQFLNQFDQKKSLSGNKLISKSLKHHNQTFCLNKELTKQDLNNQVKNKQVFIQSIFETEQKPKLQDLLHKQPTRNNAYKDIFFISDSKSYEGSSQKNKRSKSNDSSSSKTQTAEVVRNNQDQKRLASKNSFDELNKYSIEASNIQKASTYRNKELKGLRKIKTLLQDLYDSSQSQNSDKSSNRKILQNNQIIDIEINKPIAQTQLIYSKAVNTFERPQKISFWPQTKRQKSNQNSKKNGFQRNKNLLDVTTWKSSGPSDMFQVQQEVDEIESTGKKPYRKAEQKLRNSSSEYFQSKDELYIPRREEKGRKKLDRQGLQGSECPDCKAFYDALSQDSKNFKNMCQCTSRHKSSTTFMAKHKVSNFSQDFQL